MTVGNTCGCMRGGERMESIARKAVVCSARHFVAAHSSAKNGTPVDFGAVCIGCQEWDSCHGNWMVTAESLFNAAGVRPDLITPSAEQPP